MPLHRRATCCDLCPDRTVNLAVEEASTRSIGAPQEYLDWKHESAVPILGLACISWSGATTSSEQFFFWVASNRQAHADCL